MSGQPDSQSSDENIACDLRLWLSRDNSRWIQFKTCFGSACNSCTVSVPLWLVSWYFCGWISKVNLDTWPLSTDNKTWVSGHWKPITCHLVIASAAAVVLVVLCCRGGCWWESIRPRQLTISKGHSTSATQSFYCGTVPIAILGEKIIKQLLRISGRKPFVS